MLGYGATRLLPKRTSRKKEQFGILRVDNLFDPMSQLVNASRHLYHLKDEQFETFLQVMKSLLMYEKDVTIQKDTRYKNKINIINQNYSVTLDELSDGYRTMVALAVDILMALNYLNWSPADGEAIVLIDELDSHLHPQWTLQIVTRMREAFPNIQFIVTSHNPLCLRGLEDNEIRVLKRGTDNNVFIEADLPPQGKLEVERLLKSQFFGLNNTLDPHVNEEFNEYYRLLALEDEDSSFENLLKLATLKDKLISNDYLGKTPREQLMYDVIDKYMAKAQYNPLKNLSDMEAETKEKLLQILSSVDSEGGNN